MSDKIKTNPNRNRRPNRAFKLAGAAALVAVTFAAGHASGSDSVEKSKPVATTAPAPETTTNKIHEQALLDQQQQLLDKMQTQIDSLSEVVARQAGVSVEAINGSFPTLEQLPGYGQKVSPEAREAFEGTVVKMGKRPKGSEEVWQEVCTANKVSYEGNDYVLTAAHCFTRDDVHLAGKGGGDMQGLDITTASPFEYAVLDATIPSEQRVGSSLATVNTAALLYGGSDLALFTINPTPEFEAMPSLSLSEDAPIVMPGQEVALRSLPAASGNQPVTETGYYLGRINGYDVAGISPAYDIVGVSGISAEDEDACNYGASGSSAMTAEGQPLFSLSIRNQVSDYGDGTSNMVEGDPTMNSYLFAEALGVDVVASGFDVLCAYAAPQFGDIQKLINPVDPTPFLDNPALEPIAGGK